MYVYHNIIKTTHPRHNMFCIVTNAYTYVSISIYLYLFGCGGIVASGPGLLSI